MRQRLRASGTCLDPGRRDAERRRGGVAHFSPDAYIGDTRRANNTTIRDTNPITKRGACISVDGDPRSRL